MPAEEHIRSIKINGKKPNEVGYMRSRPDEIHEKGSRRKQKKSTSTCKNNI
jgi:hypothetical protein